MRIPADILKAAERQLDADCGIGGKESAAVTAENRTAAAKSRVVTAENRTVFCRAPRFPERAYMTDAALGELAREMLEKETGIQPRMYEGIDPFFRGIIFMGKVKILAAWEIFDWCVKEYGSLKNPEWLCQFPSLSRLDAKLRQYGRKIEDVRLNFLPGKFSTVSADARPPFEVRFLEAGELAGRRDLAAFRHAVCRSDLTPDVLAAAAIMEGRIVGMAGASEDSDTLWQIGVDVEAGQRGRGAAALLVRILKDEILKRGKIPFYATSQSHIISMNTAISAGFLPGWTEIYVSAEKRRI
ncbi:MAG TPA: hypothetical protein H9717_08745 [Candidatus Eisenbergiella merdipullorum]|uniref:N-acetyltransferase domain-containing protein n=1 Tax=Candidatus Eisenbergiella merdipullorum TaxID=2838553 RepID=A0A9D2L1B9_9FIRM|nr:hypothetical protein [Candidatus Eisenbergiella merdipullorum]